MTVTYNHIQAAEAIVARIAMSGGEDAEPEATLALWRLHEGIDERGLQQAAEESARDTIEEIEERLRQSAEFSTADFQEYLEREWLAAFQIAWVCAKRDTKRREEEPAASGR